MKRRRSIGLIVLISLLFATGCWDRAELDDLALILGWGVDQSEDKTYVASAQIAIPSKLSTQSGGGSGQGFFVLTASGKSSLDATKNIQRKSSRKIYAGHRRVVCIGETLAKNGLSDVLDEFTRNPDVRLRTDIFVVKGNSAQELLQNPYPLENIPALAALREHRAVGGIGDSTLRDYLMDQAKGHSTTLPVIQLSSLASSQGDESQDGGQNAGGPLGLEFGGRAIIDSHSKLVGFLDYDEAQNAVWVKGTLRHFMLTARVPKEDGNINLDVSRTRSKVIPTLQHGKVYIEVRLSGFGIIRENTTPMDLSQVENVDRAQEACDTTVEQAAKHVIVKLQKDYGLDIFGFGEAIHRKYPKQWKAMKNDWDKQFSNAVVTVNANLTIRRVGLTGPPLQLPRSEIQE